jgi:hypothetical protein
MTAKFKKISSEYITSIISDMVIKTNYIAPQDFVREMETNDKPSVR